MRFFKTFKIPIYNCKVYIQIVDDIKKSVNSIYKKNNLEDKFEDTPAGVFFNFDVHTYYIILQKEFLSHWLVAHESYHLVSKILKDRDVKEDEEAGAYLTGFIIGEIYKFLKLKNIIFK